MNFDVYFFDHSSGGQLGSFLWSELAREIESRDIVIVVCTHAINASYGSRFEYNLGLSLEKLVIPLRYDAASIPGPLHANIGEEFDDRDYSQKFSSLITKLPESYQRHLLNQAWMQQAYSRAEGLNSC